MNLSIAQAKHLGIWSRIDDRTKQQLLDAHKKSKSQFDPQAKLYQRLVSLFPNAIYNKKNLVPGRKFEADIFLPESNIVIEVDGFNEHARIKKNFHKTIDKQNILQTHGFLVLRYYSGRITKDMDNVILEIQTLHNNTMATKHD